MDLVQDKIYSHDEVIEIIRHVLFGGTPEFYDSGGLYGNHRLSKNHTTKRANDAFEKYLISINDKELINFSIAASANAISEII